MGIACLLGTAVLWSTAGLFIKQLPWNAFSISGGRGLLSMLLLICLRKVFTRCSWKTALPRLTAGNLLVALCMFCMGALYLLAIKWTSVANAVVLQYIAPVLVLLYSMLFEGYRPGRMSIVLTLVVFGGCVLSFLSSLTLQGFWGNMAAILSGFALAGQILSSRRPGADPMDGMIIGSGMSAILFLPLLFFEPAATFTLPNLLSLAFLGLLQYGLANWCYGYGIQRVDAVSASVLMTLEPVLAPLWVFWQTGQAPSVLEVLGFLCVLAGATAQTVLQKRQEAVRPL